MTPFERRGLKPVYLLLLCLLGLTGFAQMPIFKRYYIADIPGLGWLAQFYVTHYLHYIGAILLITLIFYAGAVYIFDLSTQYRLTAAARVRIVLLFAILVTGIFRVLKNLSGVTFSPAFTMAVDISHLGFVMLFIGFGAAALIARSSWLAERTGDFV